jgi:hypothetical protein
MSNQRIGLVAGAFLIAAAVLVDCLQLAIKLLLILPGGVGIILVFILGAALNISAVIVFGLWFWFLGICLFEKYPLRFILMIVLEDTPFFDGLFGWTWFVASTVVKEY